MTDGTLLVTGVAILVNDGILFVTDGILLLTGRTLLLTDVILLVTERILLMTVSDGTLMVTMLDLCLLMKFALLFILKADFLSCDAPQPASNAKKARLKVYINSFMIPLN